MIDIQIDDKEFKKALGLWSSQFEYAMSNTINDSLKLAQTGMISEIEDKFTIRRKAFVKQSIKISQFAKKTLLEGVLGVANIGGAQTADILGKFEIGGIKKAERSANVAIPAEYIRPNFQKVVSKAKRPRNLADAFKITSKTGKDMILVRKERGKNKGTHLAYVLQPSVKIDNRLHFVDTVTDSINSNFNDLWYKNMIKAIETAKW
jgi:hypothetical protein